MGNYGVYEQYTTSTSRSRCLTRKLKVKPTAPQARMMKGLAGDPDLSVYPESGWNRTRWEHESGWRKAMTAEGLYGNPRKATIEKCIKEEWLEKRDPDAWKSVYILSEWGRKVEAGLTDDDTISTKMGYSAKSIIEILRKRHPFPEWIFAEEVRHGTGFSTRYYIQGGPAPISPEGRLDVFVMNTYPSNHFRRIVYEIKIDRADFLREIAQPNKRAGAEFFANECYFAAPAGLIKVRELPDGWGLVEINGDFHRMKSKAISHEAAELHPSFVSSLCRSIVRRA